MTDISSAVISRSLVHPERRAELLAGVRRRAAELLLDTKELVVPARVHTLYLGLTLQLLMLLYLRHVGGGLLTQPGGISS